MLFVVYISFTIFQLIFVFDDEPISNAFEKKHSLFFVNIKLAINKLCIVLKCTSIVIEKKIKLLSLWIKPYVTELNQ